MKTLTLLGSTSALLIVSATASFAGNPTPVPKLQSSNLTPIPPAQLEPQPKLVSSNVDPIAPAGPTELEPQPKLVSSNVTPIPPGEPPLMEKLILSGATSMAGSSSTFCDATPNSFGTVAHIAALGSHNLVDGTFGLQVTGLPPVPGSVGIFICGTLPVNMPFGDGTLCVSPYAPGLHRMPPQSLGNGTVERTMIDFPAGFAGCTPGSSWNFQFMYRDLPGGPAGFNFSDALQTRFAP